LEYGTSIKALAKKKDKQKKVRTPLKTGGLKRSVSATIGIRKKQRNLQKTKRKSPGGEIGGGTSVKPEVSWDHEKIARGYLVLIYKTVPRGGLATTDQRTLIYD